MIGKVKIFIPILLLSLSFFAAQSQVFQRSEFGAGIGALTYVGDLSRSYNFVSTRPAATILYRLNLSQAVSLKTMLTGGMVGSSDRQDTPDVLSKRRGASFNLFLFEGAITFEYHFLNWRGDNRRIRCTPYLFAGVGLFGLSGVQSKNAEYSNVQLSIPFGGGVKYILNPHLYLALEIGMRQTFFDYIDNIAGGNPSNKNYQYGDKYDYDGYFLVGLSINYTFYTIPCSNSPY